MSQSPNDANPPLAKLRDYRNAWSALSRLIGEGKSFSGRERNCCFLNTGAPRFADVSAASSLDFADDGRAVAIVDWDFDGRLDVWVTNRTAPRVRFLRNETRTDHHFLLIRLQGDTCNRDAIGARLELYFGRNAIEKRIKTLRAGDGYLAQSSKWVHFATGTHDTIDRLVVFWPGGEKETIRGLEVDGVYRVVQNSGKAIPANPRPTVPKLVPSKIKLPEPGGATRTLISGRVPLPQVHYDDLQGKRVSLDEHRGKPLLVNLWSTTCRPCLDELSEWSGHERDLRQAGLEIVALCVDPLDQQRARAVADAAKVLDDLGFPFLRGAATKQLVTVLEVAQRAYLELQQPLPVPCSFLLDTHGCLAAIYKGRVSLEQLLEDVRLLPDTPKRWRDAAVPFSGRWASAIFPADPGPMINGLINADEVDSAVAYARRYLQWAGPPRDKASRRIATNVSKRLGVMLIDKHEMKQAGAALAELLELAPGNRTLHQEIGALLLAKNQPRMALSHLKAALRVAPRDPVLLYNVGLAELGARQLDRAIGHFRQALRLRPEDVAANYHLATALLAKGETPRAIEHYRRALELRPGWPFAANDLAWILATHSDASIRNGKQAVELAQAVCKSGPPRSSTLATLAAAYAEADRFAEATDANGRAIKLAQKAGKKVDVDRLRKRQQLYKAGRPYRTR